MIGSFESDSTASIVAQNRTKNISQPFKELQGSNLEFELINPKSITGTCLTLWWPSWIFSVVILLVIGLLGLWAPSFAQMATSPSQELERGARTFSTLIYYVI